MNLARRQLTDAQKARLGMSIEPDIAGWIRPPPEWSFPGWTDPPTPEKRPYP
jgi:hypothetical protein